MAQVPTTGRSPSQPQLLDTQKKQFNEGDGLRPELIPRRYSLTVSLCGE
jgi:hypothetical protein